MEVRKISKKDDMCDVICQLQAYKWLYYLKNKRYSTNKSEYLKKNIINKLMFSNISNQNISIIILIAIIVHLYIIYGISEILGSGNWVEKERYF